MTEKLRNLVAEAVEKNTAFSGNVGTVYSVQDLFHNVGVKSINNIWKRTKKELESLSTDSLFENSNSAKSKQLQFELDVLTEVFGYRQEIAKAEREAAKRKEEAVEKLAILKKIKAEKELDGLKAMNIEDIDKEIEKYS